MTKQRERCTFMIFRLLVLYLINDNSSLANSISKCKVMRSSFFVLLKLSADTIWGTSQYLCRFFAFGCVCKNESVSLAL